MILSRFCSLRCLIAFLSKLFLILTNLSRFLFCQPIWDEFIRLMPFFSVYSVASQFSKYSVSEIAATMGDSQPLPFDLDLDLLELAVHLVFQGSVIKEIIVF